MHAVVLRYLDQVARVGSIRRAAEKLNVASSAVNRQILKLEAELGVPIFERRGNGVRLTPAGEQLLRHTRNTLAEWRRTRSEIAAISGDIRGEVRITAIPSLLVRVVPRAIETIAARLRTALGAIMRADHPLAGVKEVTLTDCAAYPVVMLSDAWLLDAASETEFIHSGAQCSARVTSNSLSVMKDTMKAGLGLGFFTPTGFVDEIMRGELVHIPLVEPRLAESEIGLFVHRTRSAAHHISIVADELKREFEALEKEIRSIPRRRA